MQMSNRRTKNRLRTKVIKIRTTQFLLHQMALDLVLPWLKVQRTLKFQQRMLRKNKTLWRQAKENLCQLSTTRLT